MSTPSWTSFPSEGSFTLHVAVRDAPTLRMIPNSNGVLHARFLVASGEVVHNPAQANVELQLQCNVEVAAGSWLNADRIGSSVLAHRLLAKVDIAPEEAIDLQTFVDAAQRFAIRKLNPMLETATTLFGIAHNIDIQVDHGLRVSTQPFKHLTHPAYFKPRPPFPTFSTKTRK